MVRFAALVGAGAVLGTLARASSGRAFPADDGAWPVSTFVINLVGTLVLGALLELLSATGPDEGWRRVVRLGVGTGVIGGFTTYSTYVVEIDQLVRDGHAVLGAGYAIGSVLAGLAAAGAGMALAAAAVRARRRRSGAGA
jgi:CrcB protein